MSRREVLMIRVPGGSEPDRLSKLREYVIESILRDVLVITNEMTVSIEEVPAIGMEHADVNVVVTPAEQAEPKTEERPKRRENITNREEKQNILQRLLDYRQRSGPGCFGDVARKTNVKSITADVVRLVALGDATLTIAEWRAIGRALDQLEKIERAANVENP